MSTKTYLNMPVACFASMVKLTSPYLNVVTIIGAMFFYVVVILFGIDENFVSRQVVNGLCQV